ncbi:putative Acyltransferase 3 [Vibrio coralliirubri]|nr:putative Acyltransferase 3 [Vibrio coralliirubri]
MISTLRNMLSFQSPVSNVIPIQMLRGIAAWLVVYHHYNQAFFSWDMSGSIFGSQVGDFFRYYGKLGVDIFFVISGFIIYLSATKDYDVKKFVKNRVSRVVPVYWFYTFILVFIGFVIPEAVNSEWTISSLIRSLLFIYHDNPSPNLSYVPYLTVGWTLNFEMVFYGVCAISILILREKWIVPIVLLMLLGRLLWHFEILDYFFDSKYIREFGWGILIGYAYKNKLIPESNRLATVALLLSVFLFYLDGAYDHRIPAICLLVLGLLMLNKSMFNNRTSDMLRKLGDYSYSTYLIHAAVIIPLCSYFFPKGQSYSNEWLLFSVYSVGTLLLSVVSFKYIEDNPLSRWIRK